MVTVILIDSTAKLERLTLKKDTLNVNEIITAKNQKISLSSCHYSDS
jgi:hypothetical protein